MTGEATQLGIGVRPAGGRLLEVALEALYRHQNQRRRRRQLGIVAATILLVAVGAVVRARS